MTAHRVGIVLRVEATVLLVAGLFFVAAVWLCLLPVRVAVAMSGRRTGGGSLVAEGMFLGAVVYLFRRLWPKPPEVKYVQHRMSAADLEQLAYAIVSEEKKRDRPTMPTLDAKEPW